MKKFKALIIDDEILAQERLNDMLKEYEDKIEIIGFANNGIEALKIITMLKPDLLFLDIQMPGLNGFEVLSKLDSIPLVIFTTAYDEFALKAFDTNSIDYLLKPIDDDRLKQAIDKLSLITIKGVETPMRRNSDSDNNSNTDQRKNDNNIESNEDYKKKMSELLDLVSNNISSVNNRIDRITVKTGDEIYFVKLSDIKYLQADGKYTKIFTVDNDEHLINDSFSDLERRLPKNFTRTHRSYIVNIDYLKKISKWFSGQYKIILDDEDKTQIPISKSYKSNII